MGHWNLNFSKGPSTGMLPHFSEGDLGLRVLETSQLSLVPGCMTFQGWEVLLEASSEFGHLNDRAGWAVAKGQNQCLPRPAWQTGGSSEYQGQGCG